MIFLRFYIQSSNPILWSNVPGVLPALRLRKTRLLLIIQQHHRLLYGSHLQSIMSPRFYAQYASNFNTLASIFVWPLAFLLVSLLTVVLSLFLSLSPRLLLFISTCLYLLLRFERNHFPFRFITLDGCTETDIFRVSRPRRITHRIEVVRFTL